MDSFVSAAAIALFAYSFVTQIVLHVQIWRLQELLAARSYGEYAAGKAKLTNPKPSQAIDPGF
jgi:hypothetical protein